MRTAKFGFSLFLLLLSLCTVASVNAHEVRPALLELEETRPGWIDVTWKVPTLGDNKLEIEPVLPASLEIVGPTSTRVIPGAVVQNYACRSDGSPLIGQTIAIKGLSSVQIDVLVRINLLDGSAYSAIVRPSAPSYTIPEKESKSTVAMSYARMGVTHILGGVDHLLFVFALMLIVVGMRKLIKTITAFTIAHSITLALATLGMVAVPPAPTEAVISLSIVFLAAEIVRHRMGHQVLSAKYPWAVAFLFGLFHGLGFAGALSQIGIPQHEVPLALLMFNVGVEVGQVSFVVVVLSVIALGKRLHVPRPNWSWRVAPYAIGGLAAFWTIQRVLSF
jgi:hypothetical protein